MEKTAQKYYDTPIPLPAGSKFVYLSDLSDEDEKVILKMLRANIQLKHKTYIVNANEQSS